LTVGPPGRQRTVLALGAMLLFCGIFPLVDLAVVAIELFMGDPISREIVVITLVLFGVAVLNFVAVVTYHLLGILRSGFWLDGTVLVQRGAILTRRVDLATAEVGTEGIMAPRVPGSDMWGHTASTAIRARDPRTGVTIKVPLPAPGQGRLPSDELTAIADAIMARRQPTDPSYPQAEALAQELRRIAAAPFPM